MTDIPLFVYLIFCNSKPTDYTFIKARAEAYKCPRKEIKEKDALEFIMHDHYEQKKKMDEMIRQYLQWHEEVK